jgi:hypothetical protein
MTYPARQKNTLYSSRISYKPKQARHVATADHVSQIEQSCGGATVAGKQAAIYPSKQAAAAAPAINSAVTELGWAGPVGACVG